MTTKRTRTIHELMGGLTSELERLELKLEQMYSLVCDVFARRAMRELSEEMTAFDRALLYSTAQAVLQLVRYADLPEVLPKHAGVEPRRIAAEDLASAIKAWEEH